MGTFAQKNGRPTEERPTCDAVYERVGRVFLGASSRLDHDEDFAAAVAIASRRHRRRSAAERSANGSISDCSAWAGQHDLADRIWPSTAPPWRSGPRAGPSPWGTSSWCLLGSQRLAVFRCRPVEHRPGRLPRGPVRASRRIDPAGGCEPLDRERFWLFPPWVWGRAIRRQDRELVKDEANRSPQAGERVAGCPAPAGRGDRGPEAAGRGMDRSVGDLPRTLTGGLVDPMKTKLENMVAYLAGRKR